MEIEDEATASPAVLHAYATPRASSITALAEGRACMAIVLRKGEGVGAVAEVTDGRSRF